jgi:LysR family hydrogen peroxide-inducible transcriptional activator
VRSLPSLRQLRYLTVLAERLNFTRAAEECFVTQSTLSAGIKELEQVLGAKLVERDRQNVLITPTGVEVVNRARVLLAQAADLGEYATSAGRAMTGLLRVGVIPTVAPFLLPTLLPLARERFPALKLALRESVTATLLAALYGGELDFALIALPYETGDLGIRELFRDELWLVGPATDPLLKAPGPRLSAAAADRLLLLEEGHCLREHVLAACRKPPQLTEGVEATSLLTLIQMVESGLGLALVPAIALQAGVLRGTRLLAQRLAGRHPARTIALATRRSTTRRLEFDALADLISERQQCTVGASTNIKSRAKSKVHHGPDDR